MCENEDSTSLETDKGSTKITFPGQLRFHVTERDTLTDSSMSYFPSARCCDSCLK